MNFSQSTPHHLWGAEAYKRTHTQKQMKKKSPINNDMLYVKFSGKRYINKDIWKIQRARLVT